MIYRKILPVGTEIEWEHVKDFGRSVELSRGIIQGHEVKTYMITEDDGELIFVVDPYYKVHTDKGLEYVIVHSKNIEVV